MIKYNTDSITNYNKEIMRNIKVELKIIETKNNMEIICDNLDPCFNIPKNTLCETILIDGAVCSKWINELKNKSWCPLEILYQLAEMIERNHPNEGIKWCVHFYNIEMVKFKYKKYLKKYSIKKEDLTFSMFKNSPFICLIKMKIEYTDEITDIVFEKFEVCGMNERILSKK